MPRLEFSKAARAFVFLLFVVFGWELSHRQFDWPPYILVTARTPWHAALITWFLKPWVVYLTMQVVVFLYVYLGVSQMNILHRLIDASTVFRFQVSGESARVTKPRDMLSVRNIVVPRSELSIFEKKRILCVGLDAPTLEAIETLEPKTVSYLQVNTAADLEAIKERAEEGFDILVEGSVPEKWKNDRQYNQLKKELTKGQPKKPVLVHRDATKKPIDIWIDDTLRPLT